jgi:uncharacterized RDD family membrane protein YckC
MNCPYCEAVIPDYEHRCTRCGRRVTGALPAPRQGSAVPELAPERPPAPPLPKRDQGAARSPHQQPLFRVIPFETIAPPRKEAPAQARRRPAKREPDPNQGDLGFPVESQPSPPAAPQPAVQCQAAVAALSSRATAVALDLMFILAALGVFLTVVRVLTGDLPRGRAGLLAGAAVFALLFLWYKLLACLLGGSSPGAGIVGLSLLRFDGRPASRQRRLLRLAAACLSVLPLGIGLLWAIFDEEHLTFHDHMTETFTSAAK